MAKATKPRGVSSPAISRIDGSASDLGLGLSTLCPSNTGVESAAVLLDWLSITSPEGWTVAQVAELIGDTSQPEGRVNRRCRYASRQPVYEAVCRAQNSPQRIHVSLSATACRGLARTNSPDAVEALLREVIEQGFKVSTIHLALDDRSGALSIRRMRRHLLKGSATCRAHELIEIRRFRLGSGQPVGHTLMIGSERSDRRICIYDKADQQHAPGHWVRVEIRARGREAHSLARELAYKGLSQVRGVIKGILDFKEQGRHSQKCRWRSTSWWDSHLGHCEKVRLSYSPPERSIEETARWVHRVAAPSLAKTAFAFGLDHVNEVLADGARRLPSNWDDEYRDMPSSPVHQDRGTS